MERRAEEIFAHIDELGDGSMLDGAVRGVEEGWYQREIADSAYELERKLNARPARRRRRERASSRATTSRRRRALRIGPEVEEEQRRRLDEGAAPSATTPRSSGRSPAARRCARADVNLMPALLDASRVRDARRDRRRARRRVRPLGRAAADLSDAACPRRRSRPHRAAPRPAAAIDGLTEKSRGVFYVVRGVCTSTPTATTCTPTCS